MDNSSEIIARKRIALPGYLRRDVEVVVGYNLLVVLILFTQPSWLANLVVQILGIIGPLGALIWIGLRGQRWPVRREDRFALLLVGGSAALVGGQIVAVASLLLFNAPMRSPTPTDAMRLVAYPIVFFAIFALPTRALPTVVRSRIILDGLMILASVAAIRWYFISGPRAFQDGHPVLIVLMANAFLFFDVLALLSILFVALHVRDRQYRIALVLFGLAILSITLGDRVYESQLLAKAIGPSGWVFPGWCFGWMLAALGARASRFILPDEQNSMTAAESMSAWPLWRTLLPYVLVPLVGILAYAIWDFTMQTPLVIGVEVSFGALLSVVLVRQVLGEIENHRLNRDLLVANLRLAALSTTDPLTDLPNHRALAEVVEREIERARRFGRNLALLFCDVDRFKEVNDTLGHTVGDAVLREFGEIVRQGIRGNDVIGRWGGEEFLIISPESDLSGAGALAERLRLIVASHDFKNIPFYITCSIGIAVYPADATTYGTLIDAADRAMYLAKIHGRNQIRVASDPALKALAPELPDEPLSKPAATSK